MYQVYAGKCNGQKEPRCLDTTPVFSWKLCSDGNNVKQSGYRIKVYERKGSIIFDSGYVASTATHHIRYEGSRLNSLGDYEWEVISYSNGGECAKSRQYRFSMGVLVAEEWKGRWIEPSLERRPCRDDDQSWKIFAGKMPWHERPEEVLNPAVYFRRVFHSREIEALASAKLIVTAHGIYRLFLNGRPFGELLAPGYTVYDQYTEYQVYDVTNDIQTGGNVFGAIVADGWYLGKIGLLGIGNQYGEQPALFFQLRLEYADGSVEHICSDRHCKVNTGAFRYADLFVGEQYDAEKELIGWQDVEYNDDLWKEVVECEYGYHQLKGCAAEPVRCVRVRKPDRIFRSPSGELLIDAGENISGYISLRGLAQRGQKIRMEHCEVLDKDGNFLRNILGQNKNQTDEYIAARDGIFSYRPTFTYHGFQYVRITGIDEADIEEIVVHIIGTDLERTGEFQCSDHMLNQLQNNIFRSQQANMISIPTDCPQREKAGWTGDMQVYTATASYLMDMESFLEKWLSNMRLEQQADGQIPHVIPNIPSNRCISHGYKEVCSAGWADACVIIPYFLYQIYGNEKVLRDNYRMMKRWLQYVEQKAATEVPGRRETYSQDSLEHQKYLWNTGFHYGDWLIPSLSREGVAKKPIEGAEMTKELVAPAMYAYSTELMTRIATVLGEQEDAKHYAFLNRKIRKAYTHEYLREDGRLKLPYQGMYVLALQMKLIPEEKREALVSILVDLIRANDGCLDTGFLSMPFLLDVLYENGRPEEAYRLLFQDKCPSWFYEINCGANTIWESWSNIKDDGERNKSSYNHFAFGCVGDFMYRRILGIQCLEPGYRRIKIAPDVLCGLEWAAGSYDSTNGEIRVHWSKDNGENVLDVLIPPNTEAEIHWGQQRVCCGSGQYHFTDNINTQ